MNYRKFTLITFLITSLLFTSAGVAAAQVTRSNGTGVGGTVSLTAEACSGEITTEGLNFGTWMWDGYRYTPGAADGVLLVLALSIFGGGPNGCDVTIETDGFWLAESERIGEPHIGPTHLTVWMNTGTKEAPTWQHVSFGDSGSVTVGGLVPEYDNYRSVGVGLGSVPNTIAPGLYRAAFTVTFMDPDSVP